MKVYLCGAIQFTDDGGETWRQNAKRMGPEIDWLDPTENDSEYDGYGSVAPESVVSIDREMIDSADAVLLRYDAVPMYGTPREHEYAIAQDTPVFAYSVVDNPSPWLTVDAVMCVDLQDAVDTLRTCLS